MRVACPCSTEASWTNPAAFVLQTSNPSFLSDTFKNVGDAERLVLFSLPNKPLTKKLVRLVAEEALA